MVFLRYVILFTALQSLTLAWKMDREVGSDEPTRWYRLESRIRDSCFNPISSRDSGFIASPLPFMGRVEKSGVSKRTYWVCAFPSVEAHLAKADESTPS